MSDTPAERTATGKSVGGDLWSYVLNLSDARGYQELTWEGTFADYLKLVERNPKVTRSAFQRIHDMILSHGSEEYYEYKKKITRFHFFRDPFDDGKDAVFGLDIHLMKLVNAFQSAARRYGTEKRILLLHGPVGSAKSTVVRLLKKGIEQYSRSPEGALYSFSWVKKELNDTRGIFGQQLEIACPMHEEPLKIVPMAARERVLAEINRKLKEEERIHIEGDLCPACRYIFRELLMVYRGDWEQVVRHVKVRRVLLSEKDRIGIGTFQPKDEKNQDSTELTGDINYRKIAEYGSDSDPRAFNFDGEFNIANRGLIEFIEVLKLDVAFLYDLLGASQEHKIKPKKFAQTDIDEVIIGHSVAGDTPIFYRHRGLPAWTTLAQLEEQFRHDASGLEVLAHDFSTKRPRWISVRSVFRHRFSGEMLTTSQKWGCVETTPNHSIYDRNGREFYPEDRHEILAARQLPERPVGVEAQMGMIDVAQEIAGVIGHDVRIAEGGGVLTRPSQPGWVRSPLPRHATEFRATYDIGQDVACLKDLLTVLVWYATEGHINGENGGVVISQANPKELERVRQAYARITTASGSIDEGAKTDSAWRLTLGSEVVATMCRSHCGELSHHKRLPDFLFALPRMYLEHVFEELMRTDGNRRLSRGLGRAASADYRARFFEYKTVSALLAAQVGTLATLLGYDYSVYRHERDCRIPSYRIRFVSGDGKRGGRQHRF
ncbi:MAG: serine/threonine protein kinase, partial [Deltaproteobacteria bacterium]|nr:serine/threonine protein kinase [Deltaproteobacteria bacterium]